MIDENNDFIAHKRLWTNPPNCKAPIFPLIYMEIFYAMEVRIFQQVDNLVGDIDFSCYEINPEDVLIDTEGDVYSLAFDSRLRWVYPKEIINQLTLAEVIDVITPALDYAEYVLIKTKGVRTISELVAQLPEKFKW